MFILSSCLLMLLTNVNEPYCKAHFHHAMQKVHFNFITHNSNVFLAILSLFLTTLTFSHTILRKNKRYNLRIARYNFTILRKRYIYIYIYKKKRFANVLLFHNSDLFLKIARKKAELWDKKLQLPFIFLLFF